MKLYYHKTDGGAEYYCLKQVITSDGVLIDEGDMTSWILRTDGNEFELNTRRLAEEGLDVIIKS